MIELFAHPFSSYCWKVLIALYENATLFTLRPLNADHPANLAAWADAWPLRKMPVLVEDGRVVVETDAIVEHLDRCHPGSVPLLPDDAAAAVEVRMMTRIADDYVFTPMNILVADTLRPEGSRDPHGVAAAREGLDTIYAWAGPATGRPRLDRGRSVHACRLRARPRLVLRRLGAPDPGRARDAPGPSRPPQRPPVRRPLHRRRTPLPSALPARRTRAGLSGRRSRRQLPSPPSWPARQRAFAA